MNAFCNLESNIRRGSKVADKFETWGIVEIFGHQRIAGKLSEETIAGSVFLRVDIPDRKDPQKFTTIYQGGGSLYAIHPCDEAVARAAAVATGTRPIWEAQLEDFIKRATERATGNRQRQLGVDDEDDDRHG